MSETQQVKRKTIMIDIETLSLGANAVTTQIAFVAVDSDDPETVLREAEEFLPIQPQLKLGRQISGDTIIWWMTQDEASRKRFQQNKGNDFDEFVALVTSINRKIAQELEGIAKADYEIVARGPQFDIVNIESLFESVGLEAPWDYSRIVDLRTIMGEAGISSKDVELRAGLVPHVALHDCKYQLDCLAEARRRLRAKV